MGPYVISFVSLAIEIYRYLIIGYVLMSWFPNARESSIGQLIARVVEPYIGIFRKFIPPIGGVLDLSPIIAIFALHFISLGLYSVLRFLFGMA